MEKIITITIEDSPTTDLAIKATATRVGTQYDHVAYALHFERPEGYEGDELKLIFNGDFAPVSLGTDNDYPLPDALTQKTTIELQISLTRDGQITHSNSLTFKLKASIPAGKTLIAPLPKMDALLAESLTTANPVGNSLVFKNLAGTVRAEVDMSQFFGDGGGGSGKIILTTLSPDDPEFPTAEGYITLTLAGQPANGGPPGADGGVGAPGLDGADAPVPTPRVQSVTVVGPGQDPKVTITKLVDPLNAQNVYFDFGFILPQPIVEGGGSGSGLPENVVVATTEASLRNWCQVPGSYIIIPGEIVLTDDFGIVSGVTLDGIGSGYINGSDGMMFGAYGADNVTLKNIKIVTYDCNFAGRNVLVDNCRIKTQNGIWFYGGGYHQDASYMVRNNVFDDIVFVNIENGSGGIIATGCVLSYTFNVDSSHDGILLVNNIEGANLAPWGFGQ